MIVEKENPTQADFAEAYPGTYAAWEACDSNLHVIGDRQKAIGTTEK